MHKIINDGWINKNKCSDRSIEVKLPANLENYDKQTDQPQPTDDRRAHREVTLPINANRNIGQMRRRSTASKK